MSGIAGFTDFQRNYKTEPERYGEILEGMNRVQKHRGPDGEGIWLGEHCGLGHVRLGAGERILGQQPITRQMGNLRCTIVCDGEIYNAGELREELQAEGAVFLTDSHGEVALLGYMLCGRDFVKRLNGVFAYAIWDERLRRLLLVRDRVGAKPLFYTKQGNTLLFASEIKGLLAWPGMKAKADKESLCEIFGLGPARTGGKGVFKDVWEVLPGHYLEAGPAGERQRKYWELESKPHEDSPEKTVEKTSYLVADAIRRQSLSRVPLCTFLSGGVDSSLVTALCGEAFRSKGKILDTYSFDFRDNEKNFKANSFQPSEDRPWVERMVEYAGTNHRYLECCNEDLYELLFEAVEARDLPCMADVESSLLYFCGKVAKEHKVALTGECADEIFGGYPWFHKEECFKARCFPWSMDFATRTMLLKDEVLRELPLEEYAREAYEKTVAETPLLPGEEGEEKRRRQIAYLNLKWFMQTLLDRMDRTSMHVGLTARVPLADHRIIEYVWNVPWEMKCRGNMVKGLLRAAGEGHLPKEVLYRRKSPYPKTYDPHYEKLLRGAIREVMNDPGEPLTRLVDGKKLGKYLKSPADYGRPFYGQLMAGPQLLAYLLQVNYWCKRYEIHLQA